MFACSSPRKSSFLPWPSSVFALGLLASFVVSGCGNEGAGSDGANDLRTVENPIVRGRSLSLAEVKAHGLVGLVAEERVTDRTGFCSGTLVGARTVLTAAHCKSTIKGPVRFAVFGGDVFGAGRTLVPVADFVRHPSSDVALIKLSGPPPEGYARVRWAPASTLGIFGKGLRALGFGRTDPALGQSGGLPFQLDVWTPSLDPATPIFVVSSPPASGLCFGDSGGPAFTSVNGQTLQVGVLSSGERECRGGDTFANLVPVASWLESTLEELEE